MGWTPPRWFIQIINSVPSGWSSVTGAELNQMSIDTLYAPEPTWVVDQSVRTLPSSSTRSGSPLSAVHRPQWQPL